MDHRRSAQPVSLWLGRRGSLKPGYRTDLAGAPAHVPEYMSGNGGYLSFGLAWEEGKEMPAGFSTSSLCAGRVEQAFEVCA